MVIPFSNTKLRVPKGFQSLLVGLSTEILRSQPRNIHAFAADYFEKLVQRRDQGQSVSAEKQTSLEDRYYNNQSFQEEYSVNDPEANNAATKIQAKFRGHKARQDVERMKQNKEIVDTDQQELGYDREQSATPREEKLRSSADYRQDQTPQDSARLNAEEEEEEDRNIQDKPVDEPAVPQLEAELTEEEKQEQERAARSIQARFRGSRKTANRDQGSATSGSDHGPLSARGQQLESENEKTPSPPSTRLSGKLDSDRHDLGGNLTANEQIDNGDNDDTDRPRLQREPTQLSEDFERHTQVPRDSDFAREPRPDLTDEIDIDLNDPNVEKAATRIQASFRGYKTRKDLSTGESQDQQAPSASPHTQNEDEALQNRSFSPVDEGQRDEEEDDSAAAIKIQAAYRGYRARKDFEK